MRRLRFNGQLYQQRKLAKLNAELDAINERLAELRKDDVVDMPKKDKADDDLTYFG